MFSFLVTKMLTNGPQDDLRNDLLGGFKFTHLGIPIYLLLIYFIFAFISVNGSVDGLRLAIKQKNIDTIDTYVDFDSIRQSWKHQIKLEILFRSSLNNREGNGPKNVSLDDYVIASHLIEDFIDLYVSRAGLKKLFLLIERRHASNNESKASKVYGVLNSKKFINRHNSEFTSWNKMKINGYDANGREYELVFTFNFYRWILTDIFVDLKTVDQEKVIKFIKSLH
jgi:hypothetical protein